MSTTLFWHRRDLRIHDNAGLYKALKNGCAVRPVFVFDRTILDGLPKNDQRVLFIYREIERLKNELYKAEVVVDGQKKLSALLGIAMPVTPTDGEEKP